MVMGVDIHFEMVPMPAPVPTPIPNPFIGMVFDPAGLAIGLAIGAGLSLAFGGPVTGPVLINCMPATNVGTNAKGFGHILFPPGTMWAPMPKFPKLSFKSPPTFPGPPIKPEDDAIAIQGSQTVNIMGASGVRMGEMFMSCGEPIRLPSSVVIAIPKGAPVMVGGPPAINLLTALTSMIRTKWVAGYLYSVLSRMSPGRLRTILEKGVCFLTGHPVDVATGRVLTDHVDWELPGPLPVKFERSYSSAVAGRNGSLGHGWAHSLDQALWSERGKIVYLAGDGREIEFDTFDFPKHQLPLATDLFEPISRLTLRLDGKGGASITTHDGIRHEFVSVPGATGERRKWLRLKRISNRAGHSVEIDYDQRGNIEWVRDSGGRQVCFEHDAKGRLTLVKLPHPSEHGWLPHTRYAYDANGDLVQVTDPLGHSWKFAYKNHMLVQETNRNGLSFYFAYDGFTQDAFCIRTWGDGGIYDHTIDYDKKGKVTCVTNSLGETTVYHMNAIGLVTKVADPLGAATQYAYDERTLKKVKEVDPLGSETVWECDARGNCTGVTRPGDLVLRKEYDARDQLRAVTVPTGARWEWDYDENGHLHSERHPLDGETRFHHANGLLTSVEEPFFGGEQLRFAYDDLKNLVRVMFPAGGIMQYDWDNRGRVSREVSTSGCAVRFEYDDRNRLSRAIPERGPAAELRYDADENLTETFGHRRHVQLVYGQFRRVTRRVEADSCQEFVFDPEGRISAVVNECGERYSFLRDAAGRVITEIGFDGRELQLQRDRKGRVIAAKVSGVRELKYAYGPQGALTSVLHSDGTDIRFAFGKNGLMERVQNQSTSVNFAWDTVGRLVHESSDGITVTSRYRAGSQRLAFESSLGARVEYGYDRQGRLSHLWLGTSRASLPTVSLRRYADGLERERSLPGGLAVVWERESSGIPREQKVTNSATPSTLIARFRYEWEIPGKVASLTRNADSTSKYHYDPRGRLMAQEDDDQFKYRLHDAVGNVYRSRTMADREFGPGGLLLRSSNWLFAYDEEGKLQEARDGKRLVWRFRWNGAALLEEVVRPDGLRLQFAYDGLARRIRKTILRGEGQGTTQQSETRYVWDRHLLLHEVSSEHGLTTWYWEPESSNLVVKEHEGQRWSVVSDHLGVPCAMYDDRGALTWSMRLDLNGQATFPVGDATDCPFRWPGQYEDAETGLYYNRFRYYDPRTDVYISPDPLRLLGGLNLFSYVGDPNTEIDPFGLHILEAFLDGVPVVNPQTGTNQWPNARGSGRNGMAPSGYGRLGDSENLLMEHLAETEGRAGLQGKTLTINSLGEPRMTPPGSPLPPCRYCGPGLQQFSDDMKVNIEYAHAGEAEEFHPKCS
jgi:RHS repeat-associated protein